MTLSDHINLTNYFSIQDLQGKEYFKREGIDASKVHKFIQKYVSTGPIIEISSIDAPRVLSKPISHDKNILFKCLTSIVNIVKNIFSSIAKFFKSKDAKNEVVHPLACFVQSKTGSLDVKEVKMFKLFIEFNSDGGVEIVSNSVKKAIKYIDRACLYIPIEGSEPIRFTRDQITENYIQVSGAEKVTFSSISHYKFDAKNLTDFNLWLTCFGKAHK